MSEKNELTPETVIVRSPDQIFAALDGQVALMSIDNGSYYRMDATGSRIWDLLEQPMTVGDLIARLVEEFEVDAEVCKNDVMPYLADLHKTALIVVSK